MPIVTLILAEMMDSQPGYGMALRAPEVRLCTPAGLLGLIYPKIIHKGMIREPVVT